MKKEGEKPKEKTEKPAEEHGDKKVKVSQKFVTALAIVSILGFSGIVSQSFFNYDLSYYIESLLMFIIGIGLMLESKIKKLKSLERGLTSNNITHLTTVVIGFIAILAGIFSFPQIRFDIPGFVAIKGIIAIIAIIVITIQTWIIG